MRATLFSCGVSSSTGRGEGFASAVSSNCTRARLAGGWTSRFPASDLGADDGSGEDSKSITTILRFLPAVDETFLRLDDLDVLRMEGGGDDVMVGMLAVDVGFVVGGNTAITD